jgi:hypothetical protein
LGLEYGELFEPTADLEERKDTGQTWYPPNHFRPLVDWHLEGDEEKAFRTWLLGPLYQMTSLMLHEKRSHLSQLNAIGELCAQFRRGILALIREESPAAVLATVEDYHRLHPEAADGSWHPEVFDRIATPEWQQLYVNAEHDGEVGVVTIGRESYNSDVDQELNRALDWLKAAGIDAVIVTGDFHLATQMVGADTNEFFPALEEEDEGVRIATEWSRTARRLADDFEISVGFINGKRCLGGFLELMIHCRYLVAVDSAGGGGQCGSWHAGGDLAGGSRHGGLSLAVPQDPTRGLAETAPAPAERAIGQSDRGGGLAGRLRGADGLGPRDRLEAGVGW